MEITSSERSNLSVIKWKENRTSFLFLLGVYDMSAGAGEYVMGVLADSSGAPRSGNSDSRNSGFNGTLENGSKYSSGIAFPEAKYYDLYTSMNQSSNDDSLSATACSGGICYGHGLSETAGLCWSQERSDLFHFIKVMEIIL